MPATSVYKNTDYDSENLGVPVEIEISSDESDLSLDDLPDLDIPVVESDLPAQVNRSSTDLVRLYLQEIGRVRLLGKDEEVSEAQKYSETYGCE